MSEDYPIVAIVDDDIAARRALARLLASQHMRVQQYASAEQYWTSAQANDAFCVLIDIDLGDGISGLDLGKAIKSSTWPIPIIFMTGSADWAIRARAEALGCIAFLEKPCLGEHMLAAIRKARAASQTLIQD